MVSRQWGTGKEKKKCHVAHGRPPQMMRILRCNIRTKLRRFTAERARRPCKTAWVLRLCNRSAGVPGPIIDCRLDRPRGGKKVLDYRLGKGACDAVLHLRRADAGGGGRAPSHRHERGLTTDLQ